MSRSAQTRLVKTKDIKRPSRYVVSLYKEFRSLFFDETEAPKNKGRWRELAFQAAAETPLHLEIGPGNGKHFARACLARPKELFLAVELRYMPLAKTLQRAQSQNSLNGKAIRYNGALLDQLFEKGELNNVYIHFPDPWPKKRHKKHRLVSPRFASALCAAQKPLSLLEFKTDAIDYFKDSVRIFEEAGYKAKELSENLYGVKEAAGGESRKSGPGDSGESGPAGRSEIESPPAKAGMKTAAQAGLSAAAKPGRKATAQAGMKTALQAGMGTAAPAGQQTVKSRAGGSDLMESLTQFEAIFFRKKIPVARALFVREAPPS